MGFSTTIKKIIIKFTPDRLVQIYKTVGEIEANSVIEEYGLESFSQEGEDMILNRIFTNRENGFYIDIGAHHPQRFSNTYFFYKKGWRGINIDATPGSMKEFEILRPKDTNLELGVSDKNEKLTYYLFNEPALNTFSRIEAKKKDKLPHYRIINELEIETYPLSGILMKHSKPGQKIDFLNIDVEGLDFKVLKSLNMGFHRPEIILIEALNTNLEQVLENEIFYYLSQQGYKLLAKTFNTLIFKLS